ncbi:sodium/hydrogen exchanger 2-like isoform X4 [Durio zibethinus]|uniref:Sodium/hydrogen exchanger 2-like isoform X4 n=1 Tax=Durio zibethinus TaxID=66656 RepID=A0A6P6B1L2_DURZI|nr:sodium/hydrogen exchanger 2-like isoform X4 [Durio zibethinus]
MALEPDQAPVDSITLFVALLCSCIVLGHLLEKNRWFNESIIALAIGLCTGIVILFTTEGQRSHLLVFNEELFFIYLLPPIIFNAGFQVKKKQFFHNFVTIILFGAVGTLISFVIISIGTMKLFKKLDIGFLDIGDYLDYFLLLALGAIFSATDSVCTLQVLNQDETPLLYSIVFGEGVVNDATSIVLFNAIQKFDLSHITSSIFMEFMGNFLYFFITSTLLGVAVGLVSAYIIKKLYIGRHSTDREVSLMILMAYLSYMMAELFDLSSILTVFFCGIVMSHYTWHNVTEGSRITTKHAFATLSFISEIFIFLYVGMDALDIEKWQVVIKSPGTSAGVTIWWAGLMRGSVSVALAYNQFTRSGRTQLLGNAIMITSTISVVLFSTVVFGLMTKPLIRLLLSSKHLSSTTSSESFPYKPMTDPPLTANGQTADHETGGNNIPRPTSLRMLLTTPANTVHYYWRKFDDSVMRPLFGGRGFAPYAPGSPTEPLLH